MKKSIILLSLISLSGLAANSQTVTTDTVLVIKKIMSVAGDAIRITRNPVNGKLYYLTQSGNIYELDTENKSAVRVSSSAEHSLSNVQGFTIGPDGTFYIVATIISGGTETGYIKKGTLNGNSVDWKLLAKTEAYVRGAGRDHQLNACIVMPDSSNLLVNIGSRSDHGEENAGAREIPITSCIVKIPVDEEDLILYNDSAKLAPYFFADGVRNTFDLEYAPNGDLFGAENSDTRDNHEELNWIREGRHYGFPWRIGIYDNPQQFPDFDPPGSDPLLVVGINMEGTFHNDPDFPPPPAGVVFTDPVLNTGPDADIFRDPVTGEIRDASETDTVTGTFTPHSSPLAVVFDTGMKLPGRFRGKGFAMSYNDATLKKYAPFGEPGEDLLMLDLVKDEENDNYRAAITRIAKGFKSPVDAVLVDKKLYIIETAGGSLYEVSFGSEENSTSAGDLSNTFSAYFDKNVLVISTDRNFIGPATLSVYSLNGSLVDRELITSAALNDRRIEIYLDRLEKGFYLVTFQSDGLTFTKKFIR